MEDKQRTQALGVTIVALSVLVAIMMVAVAVLLGGVGATTCTVANGCQPQPTLVEFHQTNLTSSVSGVAPNNDPYLIDAWGLSFGDPGRIWVNAQSGYSIVYNSTGGVVMVDDSLEHPGELVPLRVQIPNDPAAGEPAPLTGLVFNPLHGQPGAPFDSDAFAFVSEDGVIAGWQPLPNGSEPLNGTIRVDQYASGAVFKGVASLDSGSGWRLYVTDFSAGVVEVFNSTYSPVAVPGGFVDPDIPLGYAPFGIQALNGLLYVTFAKQSIDQANDVKGLGNGFVDVFDANGHLVHRLIRGGQLNSPWGLALAPSNYGSLSGLLLVGNFGDGHINLYNATTGQYVGTAAENGAILQIDDLWSLTFGTNNGAGLSNQLYFTAGSSAESQGIFGMLDNPQVNPT